MENKSGLKPVNKHLLADAKRILKDSGYYVDNLWSIEDVLNKQQMSAHMAMKILDNVFTDDYVIGQINGIIQEEVDMYKPSVLDNIMMKYPDEEFLTVDGFNECVVGVEIPSMRLLYSRNKIIEQLVTVNRMSESDAMEHYTFNIRGSYVGEKTPLFVELYDI